jgi:hypothetical protein
MLYINKRLQAVNPAFQEAHTWSTYAGKLTDKEEQIIKQMSKTNIIKFVMNNLPQNTLNIITYKEK